MRRRDVAANLFQALIDIVGFHHAAARWLSKQVRNEREYACDDLAVSVTGDAPSYVRALATLEDARSNGRLAVAAASGTLLDRIQRILGQRPTRFAPLYGISTCGIALLVAAVLLTLALNVPPPWLAAGIRIRRPPPRPVAVGRVADAGSVSLANRHTARGNI